MANTKRASRSIGMAVVLTTAGLAQNPRFAVREKDCFEPVAPSGQAIVFDGDGDGVPDILVGNGDQLVFYRNDGSAHFTRGATSVGNFLASHSTQTTAVGDIDGDGDDDLFTTGVVRNLGNGQMAPTVSVFPPGFVLSVGPKFFDADNDGDLDVISKIGTAVHWATNDGTGTFTDRGVFVVPGGAIFDIAILDAELDGDQDLVAATLFSTVLLRNDGSGNFTVDPSAFLGIPGSLLGIATAADFDGDGYGDVVLRGPGNQVLRNDGSGHFTSAQMTGLSDLAYFGNWCEWNQDGRADLLMWGPNGEDGIYLNAGNFAFAFQPAPPRIRPTDAPWFADLDGDLDLDLVRGGEPVQVSLNTTVGMMHATTTATATVVPPLVRGFGVNSEGDVLAVCSPISPGSTTGGLYLFHGTQSSVEPTYLRTTLLASAANVSDASLAFGYVAYCNTNGPVLYSLTWGSTTPLAASATSTHIANGDLDGDGDVEFVLGDPNADGPEILRRTVQSVDWFSTGRIAVPPPTPHPSPAKESVVVVDMNGDGVRDIVHELRVLHGVGDGTFVLGADFAPTVGATARRLLPFDLDGDGDQDLLAYGGSTTQILRNDGTSFTDASLGHLPTTEFGTTAEASAADVDRDGDADLLLCRNSAATLLLNSGGVLTRVPSITPPGVFVDGNRDGWPDVFTGRQAYRNLHNHLWTPYRPALGVDWPIRIETWRQGPAAQFAIVAIGQPTQPIELPGLGTLGVDLTQPTAFYVEPLVGGKANVSLTIPGSPTALGIGIATQAVIVDLQGLRLTRCAVEPVF